MLLNPQVLKIQTILTKSSDQGCQNRDPESDRRCSRRITNRRIGIESKILPDSTKKYIFVISRLFKRLDECICYSLQPILNN